MNQQGKTGKLLGLIPEDIWSLTVDGDGLFP